MIEIYLRLDEYDFWIKKRNIQSTPKCTIKTIEILLQELSKCDTGLRKIQLYNGYLELLSSFQNTIQSGKEQFDSLSTLEKVCSSRCMNHFHFFM